jgi:hypothetical protein
VDTGVGATRTVQFELAPLRDLTNGAIDFSLHGPRVFLDLPPAVTSAGILDEQLESRHMFNIS